ncbi:unnamed protein product [Rhizoctonia solani]|uniref:Heat shock 70 kDa protein 12A n=1 Tax=Rhizoctonia solani TaxID=456999 RepID=A0A8H3H0X5_9AGAM|nr:unnamed protein product [Rhizoctonia solani]
MPTPIDDVPWGGKPEFVVGLDIGTAHSSVTFSYLQPGRVPLPERVTHWPSAAGFGGTDEAKTASKLYYDKYNQLKVAGAEVYTPRNRHAAKDQDWHLVRYFKLFLHPPAMANYEDFNFEALPAGLTIETVYADIIRYLLEHTKKRINERSDMEDWEELSRNITLVIAHPNGWGVQQQARLRSSVVMSGFIGGDDSVRRVRFVPEAEASVHYILWKQYKNLEPGDQFIVCDAGGSTVDTAAYVVQGVAEGEMSGDRNPETATVTDAKKGIRTRLTNAFRSNKSKSATPTAFYSPTPSIRLKEVKPSDCQPAGGIFVNEAFIKYLKSILNAQPPEQQRMVEQFIQKGEENFELHCKREFNTGPEAQQYYVVEAGVSLPENPDGICKIDSQVCSSTINIYLLLSSLDHRKVVQSFFEDPVRGVIKSLHKQLAGMRPKYIFLVGGFGASKYLRRRVEEEFRPWNIRVLFLDDTYGKAASDGSIIWYVKQRVVGRAARMSFGLKTMEPYDPEVLEHVHRPTKTLANGIPHVGGKWSQIIARSQMVDCNLVIKKAYERMYESFNPDLGQFTVALYAWVNEATSPPGWVVDSNDNMIDGFELVCFISAQISTMEGALQKDPSSDNCWRLGFILCIEFDGVELKARLEWVEKVTEGILRAGPAQVLVN